MANCRNCAAPLPANTLICEYCGSRNDIDLTGIHYHTTHECEAPRLCPRCGIAMRTIDLKVGGKFLIERCERCFGLFFDPGEVEALLTAEVSNVFDVDRSRIESINRCTAPVDQEVRYLKCPICAKLMNRVNFGAKSGVIVDRCKEHGVWLDGGELRRLFEWTKAGGQLLDQERREERKKEEAEREKARSEGVGETPGLTDYDCYGSAERYRDPDLSDVLRGVIEYLLR